MFHLRDNLFFGRKADGAVRVLKLPLYDGEYPTSDGDPPVVPILDITIDPNSWASIVSSVSAGGDENNRFHTAVEFHRSTGNVYIDRATGPQKFLG